MYKYVCSVCGSEDIEVKAWVKMNTPADEDWVVTELCEDEMPECWCNDCQEINTYKKVDD
jgi:hypothetical protein